MGERTSRQINWLLPGPNADRATGDALRLSTAIHGNHVDTFGVVFFLSAIHKRAAVRSPDADGLRILVEIGNHRGERIGWQEGAKRGELAVGEANYFPGHRRKWLLRTLSGKLQCALSAGGTRKVSNFLAVRRPE